MKRTLRLAMIGALMAMGVAQSNAAGAAKTMWVSSFSFSLTAFQDGSDKGTRITSKDIIAKLNGLKIVIGTNTNTLAFSKSAKLLLKQDTTNTTNGNSVVVVRDGKPAKDTDVSQFLSRDSDSDDTLSVKTTSVSKTVKRQNREFFCDGNGLIFDVDGFTESTDGTVSGKTVMKSASADVSGQGTFSTVDVVIHGTLSVSGGKLEAP